MKSDANCKELDETRPDLVADSHRMSADSRISLSGAEVVPIDNRLPQPGEILDGRYRIEGPIGAGGMAFVYSARHVTIDNQVAVKVLAPRLASSETHVHRFMREARAASVLRHPCVAAISDFGHTDAGSPFFVMEYLEGEDLQRRLTRDGPMSWEVLGPIALQICGAIHAAHQIGIVHRDIKPPNLFVVRGTNDIKVLDFGIAKFSAALQRRGLTAAGSVMGTIGFLSPEAWRSADVDHRADIYSLGVTLYTLLCGDLPMSDDDSRPKSPDGPYRLLPESVPRSVARLIYRCIAHDPDRRFRTVRALFEEILATLPPHGEIALRTVSALARARVPHGTWPPHGIERPLSPTPRRRSAVLTVISGIVLVVALLAFMLWPQRSSTIDPEYLASFGTLPDVMLAPGIELSPAKVELGERLFFEPRLSLSGDISCASCHASEHHGADGQPVAIGHNHQTVGRNTPTVYNAAGHFVQGWSGAATSVELQVTRPLFNPLEMASDPATVLRRLRGDPRYPRLFAAAFPDDEDPVSIVNLSSAIGAYERLLTTPSRWDRFLGGDTEALSADERRGFNAFVEVGCVQCHAGTYVGGTQYQKLGLLRPWPNTKDRGRYDETHQDADWMVFKVPGLRNVVQTAPYFHDGSVNRLQTAVQMMARHQLDRTLSSGEVDDIVAFLGTLTGQPATG